MSLTKAELELLNIIQEIETPVSENIIVTMETFKGYHQEDGLIMNNSIIDKGLFSIKKKLK